MPCQLLHHSVKFAGQDADLIFPLDAASHFQVPFLNLERHFGKMLDGPDKPFQEKAP